MKGSFFTLALFMTLSAGLSFAEEVTLSGKATANGASVAGANVYLSYTNSTIPFPLSILNDRIAATAKTRGDGSFSVKIDKKLLTMNPLPYLVVSAPSYAIGWRQLSPGTNMTIDLGEAETLRGNITDSAGNALPGARVTIAAIANIGRSYYTTLTCSAIPEMNTITDRNGAFVLRDLPVGRGKVMVISAKGFATKFEYNPSPGRTYRLEPEGIIEGRVVSGETGKPAKDSDLLALSFENGNSLLGRATTDRRGNFRIPGLAKGKFSVFLLPGAEETGLTSAPVENIALKPGETVRGIELKLLPGGIVTGKITDADTGAPVPGHGLVLRTPNAPLLLATAATDTGGRYSLRAPAGKYEVITETPAGFIVTTSSTRKTVAVAEGGTSAGTDFSFQKGLTIRGTVRSPAGIPLADVTVEAAMKRVYFPLGTTVSDSAGRFELSGFAENATVFLSAKLPAQKLNAELDWQVRPGVEPELRLAPYETADVQGTILDDDGTPVPDADVSLTIMNPKTGSGISYVAAHTDTAGKYRVNGIIIGSNSSLRGKKEKYTTAEILLPPLTPGIVDAGTTSLQKAERWLTGVIRDTDGSPVSGARIVMDEISTTTDETGNYRFEGIAPLVIPALSVYHRDYDFFRFEYLPTNEQTDLTLRKGAYHLSGKVVDESGAPLRKASVGIYPQQHPSGKIYGFRPTGNAGEFRLDSVLDDTVTVYIGHSETGRWTEIPGVRLSIDDTTFVLEKREISAADSAGTRPEWEFDPASIHSLNPAPEIEADRWLNGGPVTLAGLRGKIVILDFWSSTLQSSVNALRLMRKLGEYYGDSGVVIIGVHRNTTDTASVERTLAEQGIAYPVAIDRKSPKNEPGGMTMDKYGDAMFNAIINRDGTVTPDIPDSELEKTLKELLKAEARK